MITWLPRYSLLVGSLLVLALGATSARADCTAAKLKAIGKKEAALLKCQAKVASSGDSSKLGTCESNAMAKFSAAFGKAGTCLGEQGACEHFADSCEASVAGAFVDTPPSACEAAKRNAAAKLAKAELGCYSKAAAKSQAVDPNCLPKATEKFSTTIANAGTCPDGGSPQALVEDDCVKPVVTTTMIGFVVLDICRPSVSVFFTAVPLVGAPGNAPQTSFTYEDDFAAIHANWTNLGPGSSHTETVSIVVPAFAPFVDSIPFTALADGSAQIVDDFPLAGTGLESLGVHGHFAVEIDLDGILRATSGFDVVSCIASAMGCSADLECCSATCSGGVCQ